MNGPTTIEAARRRASRLACAAWPLLALAAGCQLVGDFGEFTGGGGGAGASGGGAGGAGSSAGGAGGGSAGGGGDGNAGGAGGGNAGGAAGGGGGAGGAASPFVDDVLAVGGNHSCVRHEGNVYCWGANHDGQVGGNNQTVLAAQQVQFVDGTPLANVRAIAAGLLHSVALTGGNAFAWGANGFGQLSAPASEKAAPLTLADVGATPPADLRSLALGGSHSCVVGASSNAFCWGANGAGQLGQGTFGDGAFPPPVAVMKPDNTPLSGVEQLVASGGHSCALIEDSRIACWGANVLGQAGDANGGFVLLAETVLVGDLPLRDVRFLSAGGEHTCAIVGDARDLLCWGSNGLGQLGDAAPVGDSTSTPTSVGALQNIERVALGGAHSCALTAGGGALCWGSDTYGQLGRSASSSDPFTPLPVRDGDGFPLVNLRQIALGAEHTCALRGDGQVLCWGRNQFGQLGDGSSDDPPGGHPTPRPVTGLPEPATP